MSNEEETDEAKAEEPALRAAPPRVEGAPAAMADLGVMHGGIGTDPLAGTGLRQATARASEASAGRRAGLRSRAGMVAPTGEGAEEAVQWSGVARARYGGDHRLGTLVVTPEALIFLSGTRIKLPGSVSVLSIAAVVVLLWSTFERTGEYLASGVAFFLLGLAAFGAWKYHEGLKQVAATLAATPVDEGMSLDQRIALDAHGFRFARDQVTECRGTGPITVETSTGERVQLDLDDAAGLQAALQTPTDEQ